jgi:signal peptide peptidase SppA
MKNDYLSRLSNEVWAMRKPDLHAFLSRFGNYDAKLVIEGGKLVKKDEPLYAVEDGVAVIPLKGVMMRNPDEIEEFFGATDTARFEKAVAAAAADTAASAIMLDIDSPGGSIGGVPEASEAVRMAVAVKPVIAYTAGDMASAAYWVGSQADLAYLSKSARAGSVGVFAVMMDFSKMFADVGIKVDVIRSGKFKGAGVGGSEITDEQKQQRQEIVDKLGAMFRGEVRGKRTVDDATLEGQEFIGADAVDAGLADAIADYYRTRADASALARLRAVA